MRKLITPKYKNYVNKILSLRSFAINLTKYHSQQVKLLNEKLILVDKNDNVVGSTTKKEGHLLCNINKDSCLHRAFSILLFNSKNELLLQKRSKHKITFPGQWTNTCCSHPLFIAAELEENGNRGIKLAAQRRLEFELGIKINQENFYLLERILYRAQSPNSIWGEHEIDYILLCKENNITYNINHNEVESLQYVGKNDIHQFVIQMSSLGEELTPWFRFLHRERMQGIFDMINGCTLVDNLASNLPIIQANEL